MAPLRFIALWSFTIGAGAFWGTIVGPGYIPISTLEGAGVGFMIGPLGGLLLMRKPLLVSIPTLLITTTIAALVCPRDPSDAKVWTCGTYIVTATLAALLVPLARVRLPFHCPFCNYDRRGLPEASLCPECGRAWRPTSEGI